MGTGTGIVSISAAPHLQSAASTPIGCVARRIPVAEVMQGANWRDPERVRHATLNP